VVGHSAAHCRGGHLLAGVQGCQLVRATANFGAVGVDVGLTFGSRGYLEVSKHKGVVAAELALAAPDSPEYRAALRDGNLRKLYAETRLDTQEGGGCGVGCS